MTRIETAIAVVALVVSCLGTGAIVGYWYATREAVHRFEARP